jgi:hypothetical protein
MIAFAGLFSVALVPLPELLPAQPGAVIQVTVAEGETEEDLARRIELHVAAVTASGTFRRAAAHPDLAELAVLAESAGGRRGTLFRNFLSNWMAEPIDVEVRREAGEIRLWFDEGTQAERIALTNAVIGGYLANLESGREHMEREVSRWESHVQNTESVISQARSLIQDFGPEVNEHPRLVEDLEEWAQVVENKSEELAVEKDNLRQAQQELRDLNRAEVLSRAGDLNRDR